ncbi:MAG: hypothetical protein ABSH51_24450 [Solirubrobacteraceae bacterium]|jgi:hypothetical protein
MPLAVTIYLAVYALAAIFIPLAWAIRTSRPPETTPSRPGGAARPDLADRTPGRGAGAPRRRARGEC